MVNFVFADSLETKSVIESRSSETNDLKYDEDPGPEADLYISLRCFFGLGLMKRTNTLRSKRCSVS